MSLETAPDRASDGAVDVAANLAAVRAEIGEHARAAGRDPAAIALVAISKVHGPERIRPALAAGHRLFGENRVQEAAAKWPPLRADYADLRLHLVGPLQTNKVKQALGLFDAIESLDRPRLARALAREAELGAALPDCFVQVNTGEEAQKAGIGPAEADDFIRLCRDELALPVVGLMCLPPLDEDPALHFALLRTIAERNGLDRLSMGMSADFGVAIAMGASHVRIGTAIFGERPPRAD